nr:phospholipase-like protein [Tanacetum cinerariifolium]
MLDDDAVRLCLLIASELVFMGKEKRNFLTKHIMWTVNVVSIHTAHHLAELKKNLNFNATYNLYGFAWVFKIWILESYPNNQKWCSKKANVILRGLAWSKVIIFEKSDYDCLFGPLSNPNVALISSPEEMRQAWVMASVDFIKGLTNKDGDFLQDDEARVNCIEHHNGMCGDTEDGNFVKGVDETICQNIIQMSVEEDGVLDSDGNGPSSSSYHPGNDEDESHSDDLMESDGKKAKDGYSNSQLHLHIRIKALDSKTENPTIDLVVPTKDDDRILRTIKPNDAYGKVEDDYMLMMNDEAKPVKSSLNDMELEQEPDKIAHLDLWIDLMWSLRPSKADWAIMYFSVNEPKKHWCLAELEIHTGVVTFYDSFGWAGGNRRRWWRHMKKFLPEKIIVYLLMHGIFDSKGISANNYKITYKYAAAPFQASLFGDCGIWVCIFIYKLYRNLPVTVDGPHEIALAYRERMLEYFWNHKIPVQTTSSVIQ